ncbi:heavy-metal-associated domain-containing protein [Limnobacter humi]|uniref:Heavy-metal-associated domain-containing protein n=1 Tax=Limnobacter humi TaxID=1778671 RepID=A0ABT1WGU7_9BURK|nr:heavy-metal-associated domain-containing protein [Limnobacter humi]MCQ8896746.1 heavy-metal-associated domain-containing protein [Limnobacter humi]
MIEMTVNGMTCGHCASHVTKAIVGLHPQAKVRVDLPSKTVTVDGEVDLDEVKAALADDGYVVTGVKAL